MKNQILLFTFLVMLFSYGCVRKKGCTDPDAINYDVSADVNDGSCEFK